MDLTGSRSTLVTNVCALVVAAIAVAEGAYIVHERLGYYLPQDAWAFLFPALVMFIIRSRNFSFFFLALYIALSIQMFVEARRIYLGVYMPPPEKWGPLGLLTVFFLLALFCLMMYALGVSIRFVRRQVGLEDPRYRSSR